MLRIGPTDLSEGPLSPDSPLLEFAFTLTAEIIVEVVNASSRPIPPVSHIYFCTSEDSLLALHEEMKVEKQEAVTVTSMPVFRPNPVPASINEDNLVIHYKIRQSLPKMPPGAFEQIVLPLCVTRTVPMIEAPAKLRLLTDNARYEFPFRVRVKRVRSGTGPKDAGGFAGLR